MFIGHEFLAFALAVGLSSQTGATDVQIRSVGLLAAIAAFLPDLDIGYAIITYALAIASGAPIGWGAFWGVANSVHRTVTHSLPIGITAALIAWGSANFIYHTSHSTSNIKITTNTGSNLIVYILSLYREQSLILAGVIGGSVVIGFYITAGVSASAVAAIFFIIIGLLGGITCRQTVLTANQIGAAIAIGTITHPFGDVFMATPPPLFAPITSLIGWHIELTRFIFASHPTLNLLGVLFIEIVFIWLGVSAFAKVTQRSVRAYVDRRALIAAGYALVMLSFQPPTMADAHRLGFTIVPLAISIGVWSGVSTTTKFCDERMSEPIDTTTAGYRRIIAVLTTDRSLRAAVTSLSALTIAGVAYTTAMLFTIL